jgi:hypothetical protein
MSYYDVGIDVFVGFRALWGTLVSRHSSFVNRIGRHAERTVDGSGFSPFPAAGVTTNAIECMLYD